MTTPTQPKSKRRTPWKFSDAQKNDIVRRYLNGEPNYSISKLYGCDQSYPYTLSKRHRSNVSTLRKTNARAYKQKNPT